MSIKDAVEEFTQRLHTLIEGQAMERARAAVLGAFGVAPKRGPGRPPRALSPVPSASAVVATPAKADKTRKKMPPQFCPVPGCKNKAAPVFGMVCAKHKDVKKSLIKQYREARKAKKLGLKAPKASKRKVKKVVAKPAKPAKATKRRPTKPGAKPAPPATTTPVAA